MPQVWPNTWMGDMQGYVLEELVAAEARDAALRQKVFDLQKDAKTAYDNAVAAANTDAAARYNEIVTSIDDRLASWDSQTTKSEQDIADFQASYNDAFKTFKSSLPTDAAERQQALVGVSDTLRATLGRQEGDAWQDVISDSSGRLAESQGTLAQSKADYASGFTGMTDQMRSDITKQYADYAGQAQQDITSRGLAGSSVLQDSNRAYQGAGVAEIARQTAALDRQRLEGLSQYDRDIASQQQQEAQNLNQMQMDMGSQQFGATSAFDRQQLQYQQDFANYENQMQESLGQQDLANMAGQYGQNAELDLFNLQEQLAMQQQKERLTEDVQSEIMPYDLFLAQMNQYGASGG